VGDVVLRGGNNAPACMWLKALLKKDFELLYFELLYFAQRQ
jgi:hypothetical protein